MRRPGPYSRPDVIAGLDGRSREARLMAGVRAELTAHVGGKPSATQRALIDRASWLSLHVAMLDRKSLSSGFLTEHDHRQYLAWSAHLTRILRDLGHKPAATRPLSPAEAMARPHPFAPAAA